jgi:hypothetical protein
LLAGVHAAQDAGPGGEQNYGGEGRGGPAGRQEPARQALDESERTLVGFLNATPNGVLKARRQVGDGPGVAEQGAELLIARLESLFVHTLLPNNTPSWRKTLAIYYAFSA